VILGVIWRFNMTYRAVLFVTFFTAVSAVYAQPPTVHDELELAVRQYLSVKYDESEDLGPERRRIYGVSYNPTAPLKKLDIPELAETLTDTQFFTTTLDTPHSCYSTLEVIVAATKTDAGFLFRSTVSPVYTEPSRKLLAIVRGKMARTDEDRKRLAIGVGKMLSAVTYDGQLKNVEVAEKAASVELWHGTLHWANVELRFDDEDQVESVFVDSPAANSEDQITK
jgi:hypothetical protein